MRKKRLLILGGSSYIIPVIEAAHRRGIYVITMDYLEDNAAHKCSDAYANVSIIDQERVCEAAKELHVDGIISFAANPGVVSAAYTAEKLGLHFQCSYESARILQDKNLFRNFMRNNAFNCPDSFSFASVEEALSHARDIAFPIIVKPADSAGSRGCRRVNDEAHLQEAAVFALDNSLSHTGIAESFISSNALPTGTDCFIVDGVFACMPYAFEHFDPQSPNPFAPIGCSMPANLPDDKRDYLTCELQRMADLLHLGNGVYNIETRIAVDGTPYIMEVSPRGGGDRLCEMMKHATGIDLIDAEICSALRLPIEGVTQPKFDGYWYHHDLYSCQDGKFNGVSYATELRKHLVEERLELSKGDTIDAFSSSGQIFGSALFRFDAPAQLQAVTSNPQDYIVVFAN